MTVGLVGNIFEVKYQQQIMHYSLNKGHLKINGVAKIEI